MGGSNKKVTVGYKYYLGMHMVLCHGPVDYISQIKVDDRLAWDGFSAGGRVNIDNPGLFGGEGREGGISGDVDIEMGETTQGTNDYLRARLGQDIPAFRGVVSAVLRQCYLGINPYLKPWSFRATRTNVTSSGQEQWYVNKAPIGFTSNVALYFSIDDSGSMLNVSPNGKSRLQNMKEALDTALSPLRDLPNNSSIDIMVVAFGHSRTSILRRGASGQDVVEIIDWIYARTGEGTATDFNEAVADAYDFFAESGGKRRVSVFLTDGEPNPENSHMTASLTLFGLKDVEAYAINIDLEDISATAYMDNTSVDGVPVAQSGDGTSIQSAVTRGIYIHFDMNPAHIIRECLTDDLWGMGYLETDIDDTAFTAAADQLHSEGMGISLLWDRQIPIEDFIQEIIRHINATLYVDRVTGLFTLKLIRDDYDEESLVTLGESNITKVSDYSRIDPGDSINSVSVVYWDFKTGKQASVTVDDVALIQAYGTVVNTTIQYPGFTNQNIASRAASRDLTTLSTPLLSATIEANREASQLNIGDVFKFEWPDYHEGYVLMRVMQMALGDGKSNRVKITATEDIFSLASTSVIVEEDPGWVEPGGSPLPPPIQLVQEAPYYELVQLLGQTTVDGQLSDTPELGYLLASATRPDNGLNAAIWVDDGSGYQDSGTLDFAPNCLLTSDIDENSTSWDINTLEDLELVDIGTYGRIDDEFFRVDSIDLELETITVGRAVLDTAPKKHTAGAKLVFIDVYSASDNTEYVDSESLDVRILTNSSHGQLELSSGVTSSVVMNSRAIRPYPPGNFKVDGLSYPVDYPINTGCTLTWSHRDRTQQTSGELYDHTDGNIGPEVGTTYRIVVDAIDSEDNETSGWIDTNVGSLVTWYFDATSYSVPAGTVKLRFTILSVRDGYNSWQSPSVEVILFSAPTELFAAYSPLTAPENLQAYVVN